MPTPFVFPAPQPSGKTDFAAKCTSSSTNPLAHQTPTSHLRFNDELTRTSDLQKTVHHTLKSSHTELRVAPGSAPHSFSIAHLHLTHRGRAPAITVVIVRSLGALKKKVGEMWTEEPFTMDRKSSAEIPQESQTLKWGWRATAWILAHTDLPKLCLNCSYFMLFPEISK